MEKLSDGGQESADGPASVTDQGFDCRGELPECAVVFGDEEVGIVPKPTPSGGSFGDSAIAAARAGGPDCPRWISEGGMAGVVGGALRAGDTLQLLQQQGIIGPIR